MSWLGVDAPNVMTGWGGPPQLHAPEIGSLVAGILHNRLGQQALQQKNIAEAIKIIDANLDLVTDDVALNRTTTILPLHLWLKPVPRCPNRIL